MSRWAVEGNRRVGESLGVGGNKQDKHYINSNG